MSTRRTLVALALSALVGVSALAGATTGASADPSAGTAPALRASTKTMFEGQLLDGAGKPVDDLVVQAFKEGSTEPTATALSYDSNRYGRDHGEFDLHVKEGSFRLLVTGYDSLGRERFVPRWIGGAGKTWALNEGQTIKLGDIKLVPVGTFPSITRLSFLGSNNKRVGQSVVVRAQVLCKQVAPVQGRVTFSLNGEPVTRRTLEGGRAELTLRPDAPGVYEVVATFEGGKSTEPSTSKVMRFSTSK